MEIILRSRNKVRTICVEVDGIDHELFGMSPAQIKKTPVHQGNRKMTLDAFFEITVKDPKGKGRKIVIEGDDLERFKRIGEGLEEGEIHINGDCGMYCGAGMSGGRIVVEGTCEAFAGMDMTGGELIIRKDASDCLGAAYRGEGVGMKGGLIEVHGNAGIEVGSWLSGGTIIIKGGTGIFTGVHMKKGLIIVEGKAGARVGAQMTGGTIIISEGELLPGFKEEDAVEDPEIEERTCKGKFRRFSGDIVEDGKGVILLRE